MDAPIAARTKGLKIVHIVGFAAGCAVGFAFYHNLLPTPVAGRPRSPSLWVSFYGLAMGSAMGVILTGVGIMAVRRRRGDASYPTCGGHWLLLFGLASACANVVAVVVFALLVRFYEAPERWPAESIYLPHVYMIHLRMKRAPNLLGVYHQAVGWGLGTALALAFGWWVRRRLSPPWVALFAVFAVASATLAAGHLRSLILFRRTSLLVSINAWCVRAPGVFATFLEIAVVVLISAVVWDARCRAKTDRLHWAGVSAWLAIAGIQYLTYRLFFS